MKKELWLDKYGYLRGKEELPSDTLLGYIEVEEPKKTVTKEVACIAWSRTSAMGSIPPNAKNIRIRFDVEE